MPVLPRRWVLLRERVSGTVDGGGRNGSLIAQVNTRICVLLGSLEKRIIRMEGTRVIAILSFVQYSIVGVLLPYPTTIRVERGGGWLVLFSFCCPYSNGSLLSA